MADYQSLLDGIASVIGGSLANAAQPGFYSGTTAPVTNLKGCYSRPPETIMTTPVAVLLSGPFNVEGFGPDEENVDHVRCLVLVARMIDLPSASASLAPFREGIQNVMRGQFQATVGNSLSVLYALVRGGKPIQIEWPPPTIYTGWEFDIEVRRSITPGTSPGYTGYSA